MRARGLPLPTAAAVGALAITDMLDAVLETKAAGFSEADRADVLRLQRKAM